MKSNIIAVTCMFGMGVAFAHGADLTTKGSIESRYMVGLGRPFAQASITGSGKPISLMEHAAAGGNAGYWFLLNDGNTTIVSDASIYPGGTNATPVTYRGSNPDFIGYKFKMPAKTVTGIGFWNRSYKDGGTFAGVPAVQYLDAPDGTWHDVTTGVIWTPSTYDSSFVANSVRPYQIDINPPITNAWGIRLIGDAMDTNGAEDDTTAVPGKGFLGATEFTVYGEVDWNGVDLSRNLARLGSGLASRENAGTALNLVDGDLTTRVDTWGGRGEDYIGVAWPVAQHGVAAMGAVFKWFGDGGFFDQCNPTFRIEYTTDGSSWTPVTGLDTGRYNQMADELMWLSGSTFTYKNPSNATNESWALTVETGFMFTFDPVDNIVGLRMIGRPVPCPSGDPDGFVGAFEVDVFARTLTGTQVDYDSDGDVDGADLSLFMQASETVICTNGPAIPIDPACATRDLDGDGDVDQVDFGIFQKCYSGSDISMDPHCAD